MPIKTLKNGNFKNKIVLVRVDFNVPVDPKTQEISDVTRITATLPTINYLLEQEAKIVIISHLGRPDGQVVEELRLTKVAKKLGELLNRPVQKLDAAIGPEVKAAIKQMQPKEIIVLENIRFYPEEEAGDENFAKELASLGEVYVNDAFAACHRAHVSITGIPLYLPAYAGFLVASEAQALDQVVSNIQHPLVLIIGGAKVDTKIGILKYYLNKADEILAGGALANTFLAARGFNLGSSKYENDQIDLARELMLEAEKNHCYFGLPADAIVASELQESAEKLNLPIEDIEGDMKAFDIGKVTIKRYVEVIQKAKMIIWNGPVGVYEYNRFSHGSKRIAEAVIDSGAISIIGGGDTVDFLNRYGYPFAKFTHVSTAGGAMIEFLEGKELPGIKALESQ